MRPRSLSRSQLVVILDLATNEYLLKNLPLTFLVLLMMNDLDKYHLLDKFLLLDKMPVLVEHDPCGVCRVNADSTLPTPSSSINFVDGDF